MYNIKNYFNNDDIKILESSGPFQVLEFTKDLSVLPEYAQLAYFCNEMNIRKKQVVCNINPEYSITLQAGAMQWMVGDVSATTGIKGVGDFFSKAMRGKVTGESAIKPEYKGNGGLLVLEPTYKHIIILNAEEWGSGVVLEDGLFLACESKLNQKAIARSTISSAVLGSEGLFNLCISGNGYVCLESEVPKEELIEIELNNETLKIDGSMAIAWSESLTFTVERSGKTLMGSATSGEGLVNVYRGTGKVLMAPVHNPIREYD